MSGSRRLSSSILSLLVALAWSLETRAQAPAATTPAVGAAVILSVQGRVDVQKAGSATWEKAQTNQVLRAKERLRTGPRSRATLQLSNNSVQRVDELSNLEIGIADGHGQGDYQMELKEGGIYFFNREKPVDQKFKTPIASGAILGTEFALRVAPDGSTRVLLVEGQVDLAGASGGAGGGGGGIRLNAGEEGIVEPGAAPRKTSRLDAAAAVQWCLYYPGILHLEELGLDKSASSGRLADAIRFYHDGDLPGALAALPEGYQPSGEGESIFMAGLVLAAGRADEATRWIGAYSGEPAEALRMLIRVVDGKGAGDRAGTYSGASAQLASSYVAQAQGNIESALAMALAATSKAPEFGFAWARVAELEFSLGHLARAREALDKAMQFSPRNAQAVALHGFVLAGENKIAVAEAEFDRAIVLDGGLGNAWLGRGLCKIRSGRLKEGRQDLQVAAATEPNRAVLRSYLAKAWQEENDFAHARKDIQRAKDLDPNDPTSWLYSALLAQRENRVNQAVDDLEKSRQLNDNRSVYRSRLLLDQDRAVRSANLASIYRDDGLLQNSIQEGSRAVAADYGNASAHQFLADSYYGLRDPRLFNLRYETPWFSELLTAQLLAPVGGGTLSQQVSQQEYSKLFERNRVGVMSSTEYWGRGDWQQLGTLYGIQGNTAFAFDSEYRSERGYAPNTDLDLQSFYGRVKQQIGPSDSAMLILNVNEYDFGDTRQLYDPASASPGLRVREHQEPNLFLGWHHEWSPGQHTLLLAGRLDANQRVTDTNSALPVFTRARADAPLSVYQALPFATSVERDVEAYSVELQHIAEWKTLSLIGGTRFQSGDTTFMADQQPAPRLGFPPSSVFPSATQDFDAGFQRAEVYGYGIVRPVEPVAITLGGAYDHLRYPNSVDLPPLAPGHDSVDRFLPKVGGTWSITQDTHLRAAWTRSLGGVGYDNSIRLEPVQVAGFNQAYRSLIPESVAGLISGADIETLGVGLEHRFASRTYVLATAEELKSDGQQAFGAYDYTRGTTTASLGQFHRNLEFKERAVGVSINQLLGERWSAGVSYRVADAELNTRIPDLPASVASKLESDPSATLHELTGALRMNVECGFFWLAEARWNYQDNRHVAAGIQDEDFWQFNLFAGYRFLQRRLEARIGVLNLTDQDYRLNPLNIHLEYPRERMFYASLKLYF